ncbi:MAG: MotA/TolQ/ExbB proton channel family protein [Phycisphaerae bacterium]
MSTLALFGIGNKTYFEILFWPGGGVIGLVLWTLSIVMVALVVQVFLTIRRQTILPPILRGQVQTYFDNRQYREAIELTSTDPSFLGGIISAALSEAPRGYAAMERALEDAADDRTTRLLRSVEYLNLLGNIAPMLGLFGTVWGMIMAFFKIVEMGGIPNPGMLAEALGIKLVCTFVGLFVAIPSLTVYGLIRNRIDILCSEGISAAQAMIANFRPAKGA